MHDSLTRRVVGIATALTLLVTTLLAVAPITATAADDPQVIPPPVYVTPTPYVTQPGYAGPYNIPQGYFVSITDPDPFRTFGCATNDPSCSAPPRDTTPAPAPAP